MSDIKINKTTAAQVAADEWPVLELNEVDIERKCGTRMGFEPRVSHSEIYLPKGKVDELLVAFIEDLILDEGDDVQQEERGRVLRAYRELCDDGAETGPWLVRRGTEGPFYRAEGAEGLRWTLSAKAAAHFDDKGRAEGLVADLDRQHEGLGFRPGELIVVTLSSVREQ